MLFYVVAAVMIGLCLALVVVPLGRGRARTAEQHQRRDANVEIYRQRLAELSAEAEAGRTTGAEAGREEDALGARLLADVDADEAGRARAAERQEAGGREHPWLAATLGAALVVALGGGGYYWLGDWQALSERDMPNVDQMTTQLAAHVADDPDDRGARLMLAEAYRDQGQYEKAATQLRAINARATPPQADLLVAEGQARLQAGEPLDGRVGHLFQQALVQDPDNRQALWFLGLRAAEADRDPQAIAFWDRLLKQDLPPQTAAMVRSRRNGLAGDVPGR